MDQYGINCLSKAYESMPRQLAENSGNDPSKAISKLLAAHAAMEGNLQGMAGGTLMSSIYLIYSQIRKLRKFSNRISTGIISESIAPSLLLHIGKQHSQAPQRANGLKTLVDRDFSSSRAWHSQCIIWPRG